MRLTCFYAPDATRRIWTINNHTYPEENQPTCPDPQANQNVEDEHVQNRHYPAVTCVAGKLIRKRDVDETEGKSVKSQFAPIQMNTDHLVYLKPQYPFGFENTNILCRAPTLVSP